jgi:outer membrane protein assembly factor BamB
MTRFVFLSLWICLVMSTSASANTIIQRWQVRDNFGGPPCAVGKDGSSFHINAVQGLVKLDGKGRQTWAAELPEGHFGRQILLDGAGSILLLGGGPQGPIEIAKYSADGVLQWVQRRFQTNSPTSFTSAFPTGMGIDDAGIIYVGGFIEINDGLFHLMLSYAPDGALRWERTAYSTSARELNDYLATMAVNPSGGAAAVTFQSLVAWSADGSLLWDRNVRDDYPRYLPDAFFIPPVQSLHLRTTAVYDRSNHLYLGGVFRAAAGSYNTVQKRGADGRLLWTRSLEGSVGGYVRSLPLDLRVDGSGNSFLGMNMKLPVRTNDGTIQGWISRPTLAKINPEGIVEWESRMSHSPSLLSEFGGIDLDDSGRVVMTARTYNTARYQSGVILGLFDAQGNHVPAQLYQEQSYRPNYGVMMPHIISGGDIIGTALDDQRVEDQEFLKIRRFKTLKKSRAPKIVNAPASQLVSQGTDVALHVEASGNIPLRYQWRFNGQNIAGATKATLLLENVQPGKAGDYSVEVRNSLGKVVTPEARVLLTP